MKLVIFQVAPVSAGIQISFTVARHAIYATLQLRIDYVFSTIGGCQSVLITRARLFGEEFTIYSPRCSSALP
eukprot:scaffold443340_cov43-Prasinocladus_malaysianus.AAC.2